MFFILPYFPFWLLAIIIVNEKSTDTVDVLPSWLVDKQNLLMFRTYTLWKSIEYRMLTTDFELFLQKIPFWIQFLNYRESIKNCILIQNENNTLFIIFTFSFVLFCLINRTRSKISLFNNALKMNYEIELLKCGHIFNAHLEQWISDGNKFIELLKLIVIISVRLWRNALIFCLFTFLLLFYLDHKFH